MNPCHVIMVVLCVGCLRAPAAEDPQNRVPAALAAEFRQKYPEEYKKLDKKNPSAEYMDLWTSHFEKVWRESSDPDKKAWALAFWEHGLRSRVFETKGYGVLTLSQFQPDEDFEFHVGCTIERSAGGAYKFKLDSAVDAVQDGGMSAGIFKIGHGSIFRFVGNVPFPLQTQEAKGSLFKIEGWLRRQNSGSGSYGVTDSMPFMASPKSDAVMFKGDVDDPLTFCVLKGLGMVYFHGKGSVVLQDGTTKILESAAVYQRPYSVSPESVRARADLIAKGNGYWEDRDYEKAFACYFQAATNSNVLGQLNVGLMYKNGKGVKQDAKEAYKWLMKAAVAGNGEAQYKLGKMLETGEGTAKDTAEALKWIRLAAENRWEQARQELQTNAPSR